ncbi:F-box family protein, partial [Trifolium pratense]
MSMHIDIAEKEPKMNMVMHNKIQDLDIISTMPDGVISHIMNFLITKQAVQTCILSKRWKDLWKSLPTLKISREHFGSAELFKKFVSKVLQNREESSLHSVVVEHQGYIPSNILSKMINIALSKKVEKFIVGTYLRDQKSNMLPFHSIFFLRSLKCLDLTFETNGLTKVKLPETIYLPELVECHLRDVAITSSGGNDCVKPFIESKKLITLVMDQCQLIGDAKMVFISGDNLAS